MKNSQFDDILMYFSKSLLGKEDEEEILWDLAKNCISKLGFVDCVIYLIDQDNQLLVQKAAYGPKNPKDKTLYNPVKIAVGDGITGHVAHTGKAEIVRDTSKDPRYIEDDEIRFSEICVPIAYENTIYGVIDCEHPKLGFFTDTHLKMLSAIASISAIKIKSVRANRALLEEQERLFKIREEMLELKLKALNSQLNPHFVFNALNAIQYFITSGNKKRAMEYLSIFSKLIRHYLNHLETETVSLKNEIEMLHWYLELQKLRYEGVFSYSIAVGDDSKKIEEAIIPSFVIQTLFENTIEFAAFHQQRNQHFNIAFNVSDSDVILHVQYPQQDTHDSGAKKSNIHQNMLRWQDQIELLNSVKNYTIEKEISSVKRDGILEKSITLKLPNLY